MPFDPGPQVLVLEDRTASLHIVTPPGSKFNTLVKKWLKEYEFIDVIRPGLGHVRGSTFCILVKSTGNGAGRSNYRYMLQHRRDWRRINLLFLYR